MTYPIANKVVLITGATGRIGMATAKALHNRGANVVLTGRRQEALYPKFVAGIKFEQSASQRVCRLSEPGDAPDIPGPPGVPVQQRKRVPRPEPLPAAGMHGHVHARHQFRFEFSSRSLSASASGPDEKLYSCAQSRCLQGTAEGSR